MARTSLLAKVGLALAVLLTVGLIGVVAISLRYRGQQARPAEPPPGPRSGSGWEIRYNATLALALRGSKQTPIDLLAEMLDEDQQRRNSRLKVNQGQVEIPDEAAAQSTVLAALEAALRLHQLQPQLDLGPVTAAVARLEQSPNLVIRTEALKARAALTAS